MAIKYPNGKSFTPKANENDAPKKRVVKDSYANRGMSFEYMINETNKYYNAHGVAVIHKKPTPLQIVKVDYPKRSAAVIKEAYFQQSSTTDYNGVYKGYHVDFEAKETRLTSFPLKNVHAHQVEHIRNVAKCGGIAFLLINLVKYDEMYFVTSDQFLHFWERMEKGGKKSISREDLMKSGKILQLGFHPVVDYLKEIDEIIKVLPKNNT